MKKLFYLFALLFGLTLTSCYQDEIDDLHRRLDLIEGSKVASVQEQVDAIKKSLPELEKTSKDLKTYIESLQKTASGLQESLDVTNTQLESVKAGLDAEKDARLELIDILTSVKTELESELENINKALMALQAKDSELNAKIDNLRNYVYEELAANKEWANATFSTLKQYSSLASEVAAIKAQIESINKSVTDLETRINDKIAKDISTAVSTVNANIQEQVNTLTTSYMTAISNVRDEITAAYTAAIADAISIAENSMKTWVNDLLKGYYTIAEVEGKLNLLQNVISENDKAMQGEVAVIVENLAATKLEIEAGYESAIEDAISNNNGVVDGRIAIAIAEVNVRIENEIKAINAKVSAIETRLQKIEGDIATINEQIANINSTIAKLEGMSGDMETYIKNLQTTAETLQELIETTDSKIDAMEKKLMNESDAVKSEILTQLASLRTNTETELSRITGVITILQAKDEELDSRITDLQSYVETELSNNEDWVEATFATLEQYSNLASDIATINAQIQAINSRITALEENLIQKINDQLTTVLSTCSSEIQNSVMEITGAYTSAINKAKEDVTTAYKSEIQNAFNALQASMQKWVNESLQQYYTIYEIDGRLSALKNEFVGADDDILSEIEELQKVLDTNKQELIEICNNIAEQAIKTNNGIIDNKIADAIAGVTKEIDGQLEAITTRIDQIESRLNIVEGDINNIKGYICEIQGTIVNLQNAHDELESYVAHLQSVASNLQESIKSINGKINEVEAAMEGELSTAKAEILAQLSSLKADVDEQLTQINDAIAILQTKDVELDNKIAALQSYVDTNLANNKNWVKATFATLEQQNALADEVTTIKTQIATINLSITDLENRIDTKISKDITYAVATLNSTIQEKISEVTSAYSAAISKAKSDITTAYTAEIQNAFSSLESTMKKWVNQQLSGYYTIAEVDAMLAAMENEFNGQLASQKAYLEGLISSLSSELTDEISTNSALIVSLRSSIDELQNTTMAGNATKIAENAAAIAKNAQSIIDNAASISANKTNIEANAALITLNKTAIETNYALIAQNKSAIEGLQATTNAAITKNATDIAVNAEKIAKNAALIAQNATAINNNSQAIINNSADILQLQSDLAKVKDEITAAYKSAITTAINTLNGELRGEVASQVATINSRIDHEVATINSAIDALNSRVATLEDEVDVIHQQITDILSDLANMKQDIANLMKRIQSVTYIPKYSDGKATVVDGMVELDFKISPVSAVADIAQNWESILSVKTVYTITRAVSFIDMPIISFEADQTNGIISLKVLTKGLSDEFYDGLQTASAALMLSGGNNEIVSDFIPMVPLHPYNEIWYTSTDGSLVIPHAIDVFGAKIVSNIYEGSKGVIRFDGPVTSVGISAFKECSTLATIELPGRVALIGDDAFDNCRSLVSISIPASVTNMSSLGYLNGPVDMYIQDLTAWFRIDFTNSVLGNVDKFYVNGQELTELIIPSDITEIKQYVFAGLSNLTSVIMHDDVVSVGSCAFSSCTNLSEVIIGKNVAQIKSGAFRNCTKLLTIYCRPTTPPSLYYKTNGYHSFPSNSGMKIYVPESSYSRYTLYSSYVNDEVSPINWSQYKSYIVPYDYGYEPEPLPALEGNRIFYTTTDGKKVSISRPEAFNSLILSHTYENGVGVITFSEDVTEIGTSAFDSCSNLKTVTFPSTVTLYKQYVIYSCSNLTEIYIKSTTPPAIYYQYAQIGSFPFRSSVKIYVPSEAYEVYTQFTNRGEQSFLQTNWSQHKSQLQPYDFE